MLKYFIKQEDLTQYPIKKYARFDWLKRKYQFELEKVKNYYRNRERAVNNSNMLSRLIDLLRTDPYKDDIDYYKYVSINSPYIAKQLGIVNNLGKGETLENVVYGKNSYEIFLSVENEIDFLTFEDNWIEYESIRMIKTENTELNFRIPFENVEFYLPTLTVFEIDINIILLQYKYWVLNRLEYDESTDPNVFIATVLFPNILNNQLDLVIFNRYCNIALGIEQYTELDNFNPFLIIDYNNKINKELETVVKDTKDRNITLTQLINTIPTLYNNDMFKALHINKDMFNAQSYWVLVVSRMSTVLKLLKIMGKHGIKRNLDLVNRLPVEIKAIERRTEYREGMLPIEFDLELKSIIEEISDIVGRR